MIHIPVKMMVPVLVLSVACQLEPEYEIPNLDVPEIVIEPTSNLKTVVKAYEQEAMKILTFSKDAELIVEVYVISSDEAGNFYKSLVVQDKKEEPSQGVEVKIDLRSYYARYNFGRKLFLNLSGLSLERENGTYIIGYLSGGKLVDIPGSLLDQHIIRSAETTEIKPRLITLEEVDKNLLNTFVKLQGVQFLREDLGKSFASEAYDRFNGERVVEQCDNLARTYLYTSTFASFKTSLLPEQKLDIDAILTRDFYSGEIVLVLNDTGGVTLSEENRCDPELFRCDPVAEMNNEEVIFFENFESLGSSRDIEKAGWQNINSNFNNGKFKKRSSDDNTFLQISAYNTNEFVMEVWLISPEIDLENSEGEYLTFDSRATFEEGTLLTLWWSQDKGEDTSNLEWRQLDVNFPAGSRDGSNTQFTRSVPVSLKCLEGSVRLAFRYLGSDPGASTTYDLDNVLIRGTKHEEPL